MHVTGWIPPALPHARADRRWLLTGVDSKNSGLDAVRGHALDAGATYSLPAHSLVIGVEDLDEPARQQVRLWQAQANGAIKLAESWICTPTLDRATLEKVADYVQRCGADWLAGLETPRLLKEAPPTPNPTAGDCALCGQSVPARWGRLVKGGIAHHLGRCQPPVNPVAGTCWRCHQPVAARAGRLFHRHVQHADGVCEIQQPAEANPKAGTCTQCGQLVPAKAGWVVEADDEDGPARVRHPEGTCPPLPTGPLWTVHRHRAGRFNPRPARGFQPSETVRATVVADLVPVPADAPGRRDVEHVAGNRVSVIVTVVAEETPQYFGDNGLEHDFHPEELYGDCGWYFTATVRLATADEARPVLEAEAQVQHRKALRARMQELLTTRVTAPVPDATAGPVDRTHARQVRYSPARTQPLPAHIHGQDEIWVSETAGLIWVRKYRGGEANDGPHHTTYAHPLTKERAQLVADLDAEYPHQ